jgi:hypothetical protein
MNNMFAVPECGRRLPIQRRKVRRFSEFRKFNVRDVIEIFISPKDSI